MSSENLMNFQIKAILIGAHAYSTVDWTFDSQ